MRDARRITGWGAAALAAVLVATASPAAAVTIVESPAAADTPVADIPVADTPAPTSTPEPDASPTPTASAESTATPQPTSEPEPSSAAVEVVDEQVQAAAAVGDLTITSFDDRYADGLYDPSNTDGWGVADQKNGRLARVLTSEGTWVFPGIDESGDYRFEDLPVGQTQVYFTYPNAPAREAFFDATGAATAADIERLPSGEFLGTAAGVATVTLDEDGEDLLIGMTAVTASVAVRYPDGSPATGLTGIQFGSGGGWFAATEYAGLPGSYETLTGTSSYAHLPDEIGLRVSAPAGYAIDEVVANDAISSAALELAQRDGAYWFDTTELTTYFSRGDFTVTLEELPTGELTVTRFDDRYPDGLFDPSKGEGSNVDSVNTSLSMWLQDASGTWHYGSTNADGDYVFPRVALGEAKVYMSFPNNPAREALFDATDATSAEDIERLPMGERFGPAGVATVTIDEDGEDLLIGMAAAAASVEVRNPDGSPAVGLAGVEFGSGGEWFAATEYAGLPGSYEALNGTSSLAHLPDEIGLRLTAPDGYVIDEVVAEDAISSAALEIEQRGGAFWIRTTDLATYFSRGDFVVTLEELPTASLDVTYFADVALDGVYEAGVDEPLPGAAVYLQDAAGDWWATTAGADGAIRFTGVAPGAATLYAQIPETTESPEIPELPELELPEAALAVWDATDLESYRDTVRAETETISFEGTAIDPVTGATTPVTVADALVGVLPTELAEGDQAREIGAATVFQVAAVAEASGSPAAEAVELDFLANAESLEATEAGDATGALVATEENGELAILGAAEYGIRATAVEGYEIVGVTALSAVTGEVLEVEETSVPATQRMALLAVAAGEYRVAPEQVGGPIGAVLWAIEVAAVPTGPGVDPGTPGAGPGLGLPISGGQPAAAPVRSLPATGSDMEPWVWMLAASLLIGAGLVARLGVRRRNG